MQFSLFPVALLASLAAAQTTSFSLTPGTSSACGAQPVLEACLASTTAIAQGCASTDYNCLCQKYTVVLTCYEQCPNDSRRGQTQSLVSTYCSNASVYGTSSTVVSGTQGPASTLATGTATNANTASGAIRTATGTDTTAAPAATNTKNAGGKVEAAGVLMGVAAVLGALL